MLTPKSSRAIAEFFTRQAQENTGKEPVEEIENSFVRVKPNVDGE